MNNNIYLKIGFVLVMIGVCMIISSQTTLADPHAGQSVNVAIIGSPPVINGGTLPTSGPTGELGDFIFSNLMPVNVDLSSLSSFDTVVLNVASPQMGCNVNALSVPSKADIVTFVDNGGKLIIYDSECPPQDYSWMPYPFTTSNPGAQGASGTLNIVEENLLSTTDSLDIHYIDAATLGSSTDAVGDMNVMTTFDPNWCVDMSGTNVLNVTGPVHTYARYGNGLMIYNGLDVDYLDYADPPNGLRKIWVQELQVPFNPTPASILPCGITVVGIALQPLTDTNNVGEDHTVTATLTDLLGTPQLGIAVSFEVTDGPNAGATGACSPVDCKTDVNGQVSFTYSGLGGIGTDEIVGCFTNELVEEICSQAVIKEWVNSPPDCSEAVPSVDLIWPPNHKFVSVNILGATDPDGDPVTINIDSIYQDEPVDTYGDGSFTPDGQGVGTDTAEVRAERTGTKKVPGNGRVYHIFFTATDDKGAACSGTAVVGVPHDQGQLDVPIDDGLYYDSTALMP